MRSRTAAIWQQLERLQQLDDETCTIEEHYILWVFS